MKMPGGSEAERHYFQRVAEDCEQLLGPEIELRALELAGGADVVLRLRYGLRTAEWTSEGHGETVIAAHADLRDQLVLDHPPRGSSARQATGLVTRSAPTRWPAGGCRVAGSGTGAEPLPRRATGPRPRYRLRQALPSTPTRHAVRTA